jgi:hypothetical protein
MTFFPSWERVLAGTRFTINPATIAPDDNLTEGYVYEAVDTGSRVVLFYDDAGDLRQRQLVDLIPASS